MFKLNQIYCEDCLETLKRMEDESINCVITSPPYYGLRDYGTATWEGGDAECDHRIDRFGNRKITDATNINQSNQISLAGEFVPLNGVCPKCGAIRIDKQIGLESTPEEYVSKLVAIFHEIRRVLKKDGNVWLNLGDSYNTSPAGNKIWGNNVGTNKSYQDDKIHRQRKNYPDLKPKDLIGIPWRVAFALQADGWWLRQDIIWHKPNPMPESVTDRCTKAHEYIFLLTKSANYFYDAEAIKEKSETEPHSFGWTSTPHETGIRQLNRADIIVAQDGFRNKRSVWTVTTKPFKEAHFATFPEDLIKPCVLAGCPEGGVIYDPFGGAGTTAVVAHTYDRNWILSELNPKYVAIANRRLRPYLQQEKINFNV